MSQPPARFEEFRRRAEALLEKPGRVQTLVAQTTQKMARTSGDKWHELRSQLSLALALVKAWLAGDYRQVSNKTLVILVAGLLYFVMPLDVIPDFLFGWGFIDDAAVLSYVFSQLSTEIEAFRQWQGQNEESSDASR